VIDFAPFCVQKQNYQKLALTMHNFLVLRAFSSRIQNHEKNMFIVVTRREKMPVRALKIKNMI